MSDVLRNGGAAPPPRPSLPDATNAFRGALQRYTGMVGIREVQPVEKAGHILVLVESRRRANSLRAFAGAEYEGWPIVYSSRGNTRRCKLPSGAPGAT